MSTIPIFDLLRHDITQVHASILTFDL